MYRYIWFFYMVSTEILVPAEKILPYFYQSVSQKTYICPTGFSGLGFFSFIIFYQLNSVTQKISWIQNTNKKRLYNSLVSLWVQRRKWDEMNGVLSHHFALWAYTGPRKSWANELNICMNHAPYAGAGSIARPVDLQPSTLPLCYNCPKLQRRRNIIEGGSKIMWCLYELRGRRGGKQRKMLTCQSSKQELRV